MTVQSDEKIEKIKDAAINKFTGAIEKIDPTNVKLYYTIEGYLCGYLI